MDAMEPEIQGLHHITAITSNASSAVKFYTRVLGLRLVKKTVNFDDPSAYHLYFGDERGRPGTLITFFDWGNNARAGQIGARVTHHFAFTTRDVETLNKWMNWLTQNEVHVVGPLDRGSFKSIYFQDPDGLILEIATPSVSKGYSDASYSELMVRFEDKPKASKPAPPRTPSISETMRLQGLHHVTALTNGSPHTRDFFVGTMNFELFRDNPRRSEGTVQKVFGPQSDRSDSMISFVESPSSPIGVVGVGTVHHVAFAVANEEAQLKWREHLLAKDVHVTPVIDRKYFKSIYFREPNGVLLELATIPPGFGVDEQWDALGQTLSLPDWLEPRRQTIESSLEPISLV